ncbi:MAG: tetratricopeptide repeat protein [Tannerellaceae bacterium]|jgi:tetratricopeptide (TPR) repeat protein|nr:tetratricopeptide repeat protein [Tannerellaceae bacterium]
MMRLSFLTLCLSSLLLGTTDIAGQSYAELIEKSYDYVENNNLPAAEASLKEALRQEPANPNNYALLTNLGTIQRRQQKKEEAILSYTAALSRQPQNAMILENRASLYLEMGETEKALNDYHLILLHNPIREEALYHRGLIYLQQKNYLWAEQDFDKMLEVNNASFYGRLGHAILEKTRGNYDESERIYNYLIDKLPREWQLYQGRAELYFLTGKNGRALNDVNKVFFESEPDAALYVLRGKIKLALYEREPAAADFRKALEMGYDPQVIAELLRIAGR